MTRPQLRIEFSRPLKVDRVPRGGSFEKIEADETERRELARRLGVPVLHALSATLHASPWRGGGLKIDGKLVADLDQRSVVSLMTFRQTVEFSVLRYFLPAESTAAGDELDVDEIEAGHIDLGEVVSETLALELDPYPRQPGEEFAGPEGDDDGSPQKISPFVALTRRDRP